MEIGDRAEPDTTATCVVVRPMGAAPPPPPLVEALNARGFDTIHCDDVYEAFARLCVCIANRDAGKRAVSLVVIDRPGVDECDAFLESLETYVPAVVPWDFDDALGLRPLVVEQSEPDEPVPTIHVPPRSAPPPLKLSEELTAADVEPDESGDAPDDADEEADDPTISQLLTDEELSMLLDDEPPTSTEAGDRP